jgi:heme a synthase
MPPLSEADWQAAFTMYKQIPQYAQVNQGMSLAEFKAIFWWEWSHRLLARAIGVVLAAPLAWFWWRGAITQRLRGQVLALLGLGGLQGLMGWYMVMSGLTERISVSQYRLAAHLGLAILIFAWLVWIALDMRYGSPRRYPSLARRENTRFAYVLVGLVFVQIMLGALVAGLRAGFTYNTWPLMDGKLVPEHLMLLRPWYLNPFENITMVQFNHRAMAYVVLVATAWHAWSLQRTMGAGRATASAWALLLAVLVQAALGIWTLLAVVPLALGIAHQMGAAIVFGVAVWHLYEVQLAAPE